MVFKKELVGESGEGFGHLGYRGESAGGGNVLTRREGGELRKVV